MLMKKKCCKYAEETHVRPDFKAVSIFLFIFLCLITFPATADETRPDADPDRIADDVYFLASDDLEGRFTGTDGAEIASRHIREWFEISGLLPGDTSDGDYFQEFEVTSGVHPSDGNLFLITDQNGVFDSTLNVDYQPFYFSTNGEVEGDVVFAGYGITSEDHGWDDYKDLDVEGKIVFCFTDEPGRDDPDSDFDGQNPTMYSGLRLKVTNAADHGAAAVILATAPGYIGEDGDWPFLGFEFVRGLGETPIPVIAINQESADRLFASMGAPLSMYHSEMERHHMAFGMPLDGINVKMAVDLEREYITTWNVVGILPGSDEDLSDEYVVIGAHYDHIGYGVGLSSGDDDDEIHNGADDNASGVGGLLELARMFGETEPAPRRSIMFLSFSAEEIGTLGSRAYVNDPLVPLEDTIAFLNMDMIGRVSPDDDGNDFASIHGLGSSEEWEDIIPETSPDGAIELHTHNAMVVGSDFINFYRKDVPILNFFTGIHDDYHKPSDDADKINYEGLASVVETVYVIALDVANRDEPLTYRDWNVPSTAGTNDPGATMTYTVRLGTMPDFEKLEGGYWLSGVAPGSPAEEAGLMAGDQMIKLGEYEITDIISYTNALSHFEPGDTVDIIVIRDEEEVTVTVTFGARE